MGGSDGKFGLLFFLAVPVLTAAVMVFSLLFEEPFPTLLMPSFNRAAAAESQTFERTSFFIGTGEEAIEVTAVEFAERDFTQSQATPITDELLEDLPLSEQSLIPWVFERLADIAPNGCGFDVELRQERVRIDRNSREFIAVEVVESRPLGTLEC